MRKLDVLDIVGQRLVQQVDTAKFHSLNDYSFVNTSEPSDCPTSIGAACYASVGRYVKPQHDAFVVYFDRPRAMGVCPRKGHPSDGTNPFTRQDLINFVSWLVHHSPYRKAFWGKTARDIVDNRYATFHADMPGNLVIGAANAMRMAWEYGQIVKTWSYLRKHQPEVSASFHYYLGHVLKLITNKGSEPLFMYNTLGSGHTPLASQNMSTESVQNLINGEMPGILESKLNTSKGAYHGVNKLFGALLPYSKGGYCEKIQSSLVTGEQADTSGTLFAWNENILPVQKDAETTTRYPARANLKVIEDLYNADFGGKV